MATLRGTRGNRFSIRRASLALAVAIGLLSVPIALALAWSTSTLQDALGRVNRDARSLLIADDLNLALLTYQRVSNLFVSSQEPGLDSLRADMVSEMDRLLEVALEQAGGPAEVALLSTISDELQAYLAERQRAEEVGSRLSEVLSATRVHFASVIARMDELRTMNEAQIEEANRTAIRINRVSTQLGLAAALLLVSALAVTVWSVDRFVLRPLQDLRRAVERMRQGDSGARSPVSGPSEFADLGRTFNEMADALAKVREGQLAFVAGVAHDLRDPLASLKVGLQALELAPPGERRTRALSLLDEQVDRLSRMASDLLDASRIEAGNLELKPENLDLRKAAELVVQAYGATAKKHHLVLAASDEPATVRADPLRVQQVIGNLVSNAIKFSPEGGPIHVKVDVEEEEAAVSVTDRGIGIDPVEIDNLFLPFRRHRPDVAAGVGLGLSVVQRIMDAHHGHIRVDSEPGGGSTFRVSFPRA